MTQQALQPTAEQVDVLLVVPPFAGAHWPSLATSMLEQGCRNLGISAATYYANLELCRRQDRALYTYLSLTSSHPVLGEVLFAPFAFAAESSPTARRRRLDEALSLLEPERRPPFDAETLAVLSDRIADFCATAVARILSAAPRIVGFSSTFAQTAASLALARRVKALRPEIITVLGGANADAPMGEELARIAPSLDYVFSGEADRELPRFCADLLHHGRRPKERVLHCSPESDLDTTPLPSFDSWFAQAEERLGSAEPWFLPFESSRGCWWGERSHCTFCGLNQSGMAHRSKSTGRLLEELDNGRERWGVDRFQAFDNIMPRELKQGLLSVLAARGGELSLFYEVKANLSADDLDLFVEAGITGIQPGIESLSTSILKAMAKGVTGPQNLALLRACRARKLGVNWNYLLGFPGESATEYRTVLRFLPLLEHLEPPGSWGRLRLDRYSPYMEDPESFGIEDLAPSPIYRAIFPKEARLERLAYYFTGRYQTELFEDPQLESQFRLALQEWEAVWNRRQAHPVLRLFQRGPLSFVEDTRRCAAGPLHKLSSAEVQLLIHLEHPRPMNRLSDHHQRLARELMELGFVLEHEQRLIGLVTRPLAHSVRPRRDAARSTALRDLEAAASLALVSPLPF